MLDIKNYLSNEFNVKFWQIENLLKLNDEGATIPFIARYRKEKTGSLDENQIRDILEKNEYLIELEDRKKTILESIEKQGKLTDELKKKIDETTQKTVLEDIYLPFKPKRRTKATIAKENGLEPLANTIKEHNIIESPEINLQNEAKKYINQNVKSIDEALAGAENILSEEIAEKAELRQWVREFFFNHGKFKSKIKEEFEEGSTNYEMYRDFEISVRDIQPHTMLALRRGEKEEILTLELKYEEEKILSFLNIKNIFTNSKELKEFLEAAVKDGFKRLMKHSLIGEVRLESKKKADEQSIDVFEKNLRQILLSSPAGMKPTIAIDPGFRTGCKTAVLDETGKFIEYNAIFPFNSKTEISDAKNYILSCINKYKTELIAIGNGTAGRETETFIRQTVNEANISQKPVIVLVNESGASVYSAGKVANEEFPDLDLTVRGAISIGRRLQDPLAELVKIEPKSIGVGQYQHDVDQKLLKNKLEQTVESCVNYVGVDLNTASKQLLTYVSGISPSLAENIIKIRNENGAYNSRAELLNVPKFGAKTFEQAAGFLRIRNGKNVLDNTSVHPESYHIAEQFSKDLNLEISLLANNSQRLKEIDINKYVTDEIGEPTLNDIISELEKPGRDPRQVFRYAEFKEGVNSLTDLKKGMVLEGVVTNITNFGAFVDIGVHQDGLVHVSEMANYFVKDPTKIVKVGEIVKVRVLDINEKLKRIQLSIKQVDVVIPKIKKKPKYNLDDLKKKFGG